MAAKNPKDYVLTSHDSLKGAAKAISSSVDRREDTQHTRKDLILISL
jgi:hypothetical protein